MSFTDEALAAAFVAALPKDDAARDLLQRETTIMKAIQTALVLPASVIKRYQFTPVQNPRRGCSYVFHRSVILQMAAEHGGAVGLLERRNKKATRLANRRAGPNPPKRGRRSSYGRYRAY